jgi:hypothetical protein
MKNIIFRQVDFMEKKLTNAVIIFFIILFTFDFTGCNKQSSAVITSKTPPLKKSLFDSSLKMPDKIIKFDKGTQVVFEKGSLEYVDAIKKIVLTFIAIDFNHVTRSSMSTHREDELKKSTEVLELIYNNTNSLSISKLNTDRKYSRLLLVMPTDKQTYGEIFLGDDKDYFSGGYSS